MFNRNLFLVSLPQLQVSIVGLSIVLTIGIATLNFESALTPLYVGGLIIFQCACVVLFFGLKGKLDNVPLKLLLAIVTVCGVVAFLGSFGTLKILQLISQ